MQELTQCGLLKDSHPASAVDLISSGIGTTLCIIVTETRPRQVGDKANDASASNGNELRCKVAGAATGAARRTGASNTAQRRPDHTDAIDNSAGVDFTLTTGQHQRSAGRRGGGGRSHLKAAQRLAGIHDDEVAPAGAAEQLLQTRRWILPGIGTPVLSGRPSGARDHDVEGSKRLGNRAIEFLPTDEEIAHRRAPASRA